MFQLLLGAVALWIAVGLAWPGALLRAKETTASNPTAQIAKQGKYTGAQSCRECHEKFYKLWAPSRHGKAMQPYSDRLATRNLTVQAEPIVINGVTYLAQTGPGQGWVLEKGPSGVKKYPIAHVLGGKNVYYFLTPMAKGKLQTLPLAYDVKKSEWFDTAASGIRHVGQRAVDWRDASYTFNTSCRGCHVSQFSVNYDLKKNEYRTTWAEPGINCETCHGPGQAHIEVCQKAPKGTVPQDLMMIRGGRDFTAQQNNATCSSCHAKAIPLTTSFKPGDKFFDHYDLVTLENPDYYPDGRDLGENYTYTSWLRSPCAKSGKLSCLHCHTSSGRFRQKKAPNQACMPCHETKVKSPAAHTMHKPGPKTPECISCHMPMTGFARMQRSDHSMLPPTPAATIKFKSPNACNNCHQDKDATWADKQVREWRKRDYQAPLLHQAGLIEAARKRDWSQLPDMLAYLGDEKREDIFAAALIRLLRNCPDASKWPAIIKSTSDPSPLVRATAIDSLAAVPSRETAGVLLKFVSDSIRLVRIRAAHALAGFPRRALNPDMQKKLHAATLEMLGSYAARPDLWTAHYNIGNFYLELGKPRQALVAYNTSLRLEPRAVNSLVNSALVYNRLGKKDEAEARLEKALAIEPGNAPAQFNLGLLKSDLKKPAAAEKHLKLALKLDPQMSQAAYNLGMLIFADRPTEGLAYLEQAFHITPAPRYGYALAQVMAGKKDYAGADKKLAMIMQRWPAYSASYLLQAQLYQQRGMKDRAMAALKRGMEVPAIPMQDKLRLGIKLRTLQKPQQAKPGQ